MHAFIAEEIAGILRESVAFGVCGVADAAEGSIGENPGALSGLFWRFAFCKGVVVTMFGDLRPRIDVLCEGDGHDVIRGRAFAGSVMIGNFCDAFVFFFAEAFTKEWNEWTERIVGVKVVVEPGA